MTQTVLIVDDSAPAVADLKDLLIEQGFKVMTAARAEDALDTLRSGKVNVVITEVLLPGINGFELVRHIRRQDRWGNVPIIILTSRSSPEDYATGYEAGADEYFIKPAEPAKILGVIRGLVARYEVAQSRAGALAFPRVAPSQAFPAERELGEIITVFSLKGGVGTSTIAVNLAVAIKQLTPSSRVGLIDLALEQGVDTVLLDIVPTSTVVEWAREDLTDPAPSLLGQYFTQHRTGIGLLAAPNSPEQAEIVRPDAVRKTLELAPRVFDYVVLDTSSSFNDNTLVALEQADTIVMPLTPDMAALKLAVSTLRIFKALKIDESRVRVVLNELVPGAGLTKEQVDNSLGKDTHPIPHAGTMFVDTANQGMPLVTARRPHPAGASIIDLARSLCVPDDEEAQAGHRSGLLSKLRTDLLGRESRA